MKSDEIDEGVEEEDSYKIEKNRETPDLSEFFKTWIVDQDLRDEAPEATNADTNQEGWDQKNEGPVNVNDEDGEESNVSD